MKIYVYCDENDHPIWQATSVKELAGLIGKTYNTTWQGIFRHRNGYFMYEDDDKDAGAEPGGDKS